VVFKTQKARKAKVDEWQSADGKEKPFLLLLLQAWSWQARVHSQVAM
jgi:hypothetical protein